jgi:hypothetical protein
MKQLIFFLLLFSGALLLQSCPDDGGDPEPKKIDFGCFFLTDENGQQLGVFDTCAGDLDWQNFTLTDEEKQYLDFPDTIQLTPGMSKAVASIHPFPNPAKRDGLLGCLISSNTNTIANVKVKLAFVNQDKERIGVRAFQVGLVASAYFQLNLATLPQSSGQPVRMFYQITDQSDKVAYEGYGDLLLCDSWPVTDIADMCF